MTIFTDTVISHVVDEGPSIRKSFSNENFLIVLDSRLNLTKIFSKDFIVAHDRILLCFSFFFFFSHFNIGSNFDYSATCLTSFASIKAPPIPNLFCFFFSALLSTYRKSRPCFPQATPEYFAPKDKVGRIVTQRREESSWSLTVREESDGTVFHDDGCVEESPVVANDDGADDE